MGEVVRFIPKSELERARLIREARATHESIFPTVYERIFPTVKGPAKRGVQRPAGE